VLNEISEQISNFRNILSEVARVPCAEGQEIFLRSGQHKLEFEVKNRCKSAEEAKAESRANP